MQNLHIPLCMVQLQGRLKLKRSVFTGVSDSLLKGFYAYVTDTCGENYVFAANEGGSGD